jgi:hypothetical protein
MNAHYGVSISLGFKIEISFLRIFLNASSRILQINLISIYEIEYNKKLQELFDII